MNIKQTRRRYTKEFKLEAIELVKSRGDRLSEVANNLGIHPGLLHRWIREHEDGQDNAFPGNGNLKVLNKENYRLKKELKDLQEERDILKKALAIFSQRPG
jgi:transposase